MTALAAQDWETLAACLEADVERTGPYNDVYRGRDVYVAFLADTLRSLSGYELQVTRIVDGEGVVLVELNETIDTREGRRRTDEAVVFDLSPAGLVSKVGVFLRKAQVVGS